MKRRLLLCSVPAALLSATGLARAAQSQMEQIDGSPALVGIRGVSLPPCNRTDVRSLVDAGVFETEGYTGLVMNFAGQMKGSDEGGGDVGAMLIPDVPPFDRAYANMGLLPESLEIAVNVSSKASPYFMAKQQRADVGFPRYRVLLFNETTSALGVSFFVYRTRSS